MMMLGSDRQAWPGPPPPFSLLSLPCGEPHLPRPPPPPPAPRVRSLLFECQDVSNPCPPPPPLPAPRVRSLLLECQDVSDRSKLLYSEAATCVEQRVYLSRRGFKPTSCTANNKNVEEFNCGYRGPA